MQKRNIKIIGEQVYLRELAVEDASAEYCSWLNDPEVNKFLMTRSATIPDLREYIQKQIDDPKSLFLGIFDKQNNAHIGNIKLEPIDWEKKKAVLGILIGNKQYWNRGVGTESMRLAIDTAFNTLGLAEVELGVVPQNERAIHVYEKVGFKQTGAAENKIIMSITKD